MNQERLKAFARNAATAMMDRNLSLKEINKQTNNEEIDALPYQERMQYMFWMTVYMREILMQEQFKGNDQDDV